MPLSNDLNKTFLKALFLVFVVLTAFGVWKIYDRYREHAPVGLNLNKRAWTASFEERGLPVPPDGPREGFWGARLGTKRPSAKLGWVEREMNLPPLVNVNGDGYQRVSPSSSPVADLLIIGGSVAYGSYASSVDKTYFSQLAKISAERGLPVRVTVFAAGAWISANELTAFRLYLARRKPDIVVFLNGLNDLTRLKDFPPERRVADYLSRMRRARALAKREGVRFVVATQPFYPDKPIKSPLEKRIMKYSYDPTLLTTYYPRMRKGLRIMADEGDMVWIDTSDALNGETKTTFSDQWHFSDPGHRLLAERLADGLEPVISGVIIKPSPRRVSGRNP